MTTEETDRVESTFDDERKGTKTERSNIDMLIDILAASLVPEPTDLNEALNEEDQEQRASKATLVPPGPVHDVVARAILRGRCPENASPSVLTAIGLALVGRAIDSRRHFVLASTSRYSVACRPYALAYAAGHLNGNLLAPLLDALPRTISKDSALGVMWRQSAKEIPTELNALLRAPCQANEGPIFMFARRAALLELLAPLLAAGALGSSPRC